MWEVRRKEAYSCELIFAYTSQLSLHIFFGFELIVCRFLDLDSACHGEKQRKASNDFRNLRRLPYGSQQLRCNWWWWRQGKNLFCRLGSRYLLEDTNFSSTEIPLKWTLESLSQLHERLIFGEAFGSGVSWWFGRSDEWMNKTESLDKLAEAVDELCALNHPKCCR